MIFGLTRLLAVVHYCGRLVLGSLGKPIIETWVVCNTQTLQAAALCQHADLTEESQDEPSQNQGWVNVN